MPPNKNGPFSIKDPNFQSISSYNMDTLMGFPQIFPSLNSLQELRKETKWKKYTQKIKSNLMSERKKPCWVSQNKPDNALCENHKRAKEIRGDPLQQ